MFGAILCEGYGGRRSRCGMERSGMEHGSEANPGISPTPSEARGHTQININIYKSIN